MTALGHRVCFFIHFVLSMQIAISSSAMLAAVAADKPSSGDAVGAIVAPGYEQIGVRLSAFINGELKDKDIPSVSIALVDGDKIVFAQAYGAASADGKTPATTASVYRVGSVSKLLTDLCVMQLVAAGKLDLDADVRKYLPDVAPENPFGVPITLRQLMCHQSGVVRESPVGHYFDDTSPSIADTVKSLNSTTLIYKPGRRTKYSNAGVSVAGFVVERLTGKPFETYIREVLLDPLDMPNSGFVSNDAIEKERAIGWMRSHHAPTFVAPNFALGTLPAGNLYSSMPELSHFMIALLGGGEYRGKRVIEKQVLDSMLQPIEASDDNLQQYGIGFRMGKLDGRRTFGHGGAVYGYSTQFLGLPDEKVGASASASVDGANGVMRRLTEYATRLLLAKKENKTLPDIEETKPISRELIEKLVGTYAGGSKFVRIFEEGGDAYFFDGAYRKRLRASGEGFAVDDLTGFGPKIIRADDGRLLYSDRAWSRVAEPKPSPSPSRFANLIGEYGWDYNVLYIYEDRGQLWALIEWFDYCPLTEISPNVFAFPEEGLYHGEQIVFETDGDRPATCAVAASVRFDRRPAGIDGDKPFQITPSEPVEELYRIARAATPPKEYNRPRSFDLVELVTLDPTIKLDIRYASINNFMGTPFYKQARAFLQRPAAEALVRVHKKLKDKGYGLLIHDGYRPWYVTKMFWEGTTPAQREFVADPSQGSKHNRGCAVDLTLYDLKTGEAVKMVSGYDEMTQRSYPFYPGGTSLERWHRDLLRKGMESEGFAVYPVEWWHFDYKDWEQYPIGTVSFEEIKSK
jgi:CubicO group peptidase (beta-lactamase class C family)/D-alanyl-D-alanine dipeptidase